APAMTCRPASADCTKAVVAIDVSLSPAVGVGAFGSPVNVGDARSALADTAFATNAVVAMLVSLSPGAAVGAVGLPVSAGEASGAKPSEDLSMPWMCVASVHSASWPIVGVPLAMTLPVPPPETATSTHPPSERAY